MVTPLVIVILSGKRKSGKDYYANLLVEKLGPQTCDIVRLSAPLKKRFAEIHELDYDKLLDSSSYKEAYRDDMIKWGETERDKNPEIFCRQASESCTKSVWIVTDARRPTDIQYFKTRFPNKIILIRIVSSEKTRQARGWIFKQGVDDALSECGLDSGIKWDFMIDNDQDISLEDLENVCNIIRTLAS